jgi:hypothetical protein
MGSVSAAAVGWHRAEVPRNVQPGIPDLLTLERKDTLNFMTIREYHLWSYYDQHFCCRQNKDHVDGRE